jgi:hypothetical protein
MTLQEKFDAARAILEAHNTTVELSEEKVNVDSFIRQVRKNGGTSDARLARIKWEDLERWGVPTLLAREVAEIFRGPETVVETKPEKIVIIDDDPVKLAAKLKPTELVEKYDPEEADNPFGVRLKALSGGQRFIVFKNDGTVNVPVSQNLLQELRDNYPERQNVVVGDEVHFTYAVGVRPSRYADEHPMYPGTMLRPDGTSDADIDWKPVTLQIRQLVYLAVKTGDIKGKDEQDVRDLVEGKTFNDLGKRWKNAALKFKELSETNQLPQLKIKLGVAGNGKQQNPFAVGNRVW